MPSSSTSARNASTSLKRSFSARQSRRPKCQSKKLVPQLSVFAVSAKERRASPKSAGSCGSCGDPRGPGACSLED